MGTKAFLILTIILSLSVCANAQDESSLNSTEDKLININDNSILLTQYCDTIFVEDPITGELKIVIDNEDLGPIKLNGEKIYSPFNNTDLQHYTKLRKGKKYLVQHLQRKTNKYYKRLVKAGYNADIRNIVVNAKGKIIYYEYSGVVKTDTTNPATLKPKLICRINNKAKETLDKVKLMPAIVDHTIVAYRINHYELL